jgi:hypothetical protein
VKIFLGPYPDANHEREEEIVIHEHDHWNLNRDIALILIPLLENFREKVNGFPGTIHENNPENGFEVWKSYLTTMISAFQIIVSVNDFERSPQQERIVKDGLDLFARYFEHLWD